MARYGEFYENKVTGERGVVLRGDEDERRPEPALVHLVVQPHGAVAGEHIHPRFQGVVPGHLRGRGTRVDGAEREPLPPVRRR